MVFATSALAGIGFTVALFVTSLAFTDALHVAGSKVGILSGSVFALLLGLGLLRASLPKQALPVALARGAKLNASRILNARKKRSADDGASCKQRPQF